ncbi:SET domain-containing protein 9-like [Babylonia areolata]|uniref:SET domain-containing protein 9-like n=1 Tax=Babylonia areolata TaxID=304850 RepID=UPI003FD0B88A
MIAFDECVFSFFSMERLLKKWKQYRYRFVPWIALNLKDRSVRSVPKGATDKLASDAYILDTLTGLLSAFHKCCNGAGQTAVSRHGHGSPRLADHNLGVMREVMGFTVQRRVSSIAGGGRGVAVTDGRIPKGVMTSLYPGLIYENYEPILFQSLGNPFIFRCIDSLLVDGNDKCISKFLYRSCYGRDRVGPYPLCDESWLTDQPLNPLAVGQYVNNHNKENPANVAYQEFDVPADFPLHLRQYLPNTFYSSSLDRLSPHERLTRLVVLVSTRDIECGEELFSSYFTVVH